MSAFLEPDPKKDKEKKDTEEDQEYLMRKVPSMQRLTGEQKAHQLRSIIRRLRKDKHLRDRGNDEIKKIAESYQELDFQAKKAQQEEKNRRDMGIKMPKKNIIKHQ